MFTKGAGVVINEERNYSRDHDLMEEFDRQLQAMADDHETRYISLSDDFPEEYKLGDRLHLSELGHIALTGILIDEIEKHMDMWNKRYS